MWTANILFPHLDRKSCRALFWCTPEALQTLKVTERKAEQGHQACKETSDTWLLGYFEIVCSDIAYQCYG